MTVFSYRPASNTHFITKLHLIKALFYICYSHVYNNYLLDNCNTDKSWLSKFIPRFNQPNLFISNLFNYFYV